MTKLKTIAKSDSVEDKPIKNMKAVKRSNVNGGPSPGKKVKVDKSEAGPEKTPKFAKENKNGVSKMSKKAAKSKVLPFTAGKGPDGKPLITEKIEDWTAFKKERKELKVQRIKAKTKDNFDRIQEAKKMGEKLRLKTLKEDSRNVVINKLHGLLKGHYCKFVLAHDTARIVQWLLKYASKILVHQISQELVPATIDMIHSKYGVFCLKRLLKYGADDIRSLVIDQFQGHVVKLVSHTVSAPVFEYAYSTFATPKQKQLLIQEMYSDFYKNSKDHSVEHLKDVYKDDKHMKMATLTACNGNIKKVLNKSLLDSGLVQSVLNQYLEECSAKDKAELISELAPHVVVISNSKDGSRAAMQCIWNGTAKDKKTIMKSLKEHLIDLCKHEFGHRTIITLLDSVDDTVALHKIVLSEILKNAKDLAVTEWGRKVLLWLVAPAHSTIFHPLFIRELNEGRESSNSKKTTELRRQELLSHSITTLLSLISEDTRFWLSSGSLAIEMLAIIKAGAGEALKEVLSKVADTILEEDWTIKTGEKEELGIEHAGIHMVLKKLAQHDKTVSNIDDPTFGSTLVEKLTKDIIKRWLPINRGCFLLVAVFENNNKDVQEKLRAKLKPCMKLLKAQTFSGAKILLKHL